LTTLDGDEAVMISGNWIEGRMVSAMNMAELSSLSYVSPS